MKAKLLKGKSFSVYSLGMFFFSRLPVLYDPPCVLQGTATVFRLYPFLFFYPSV
jgi:hypothetical protein